MMRWVFRFLGFEIFSVDTIEYALIDEDEESPAIGGGSAHNFERDGSPLDALGEEPWDNYFGFRGGQ